MFVEQLKKEFGTNTPIFIDEILKMYRNYSRAYVFRLIKQAEKSGELSLYSRGVYYVPRQTLFGKSNIIPEMVVEKKYLRDGNSIYGVYAGTTLLNYFGLTTQVPNIIELITNKESTRKRSIYINDKEFIIRKSRCNITSDNYPEYTLLQLFSEMGQDEKITKSFIKEINQFIVSNNVTKEKLFKMASNFPSTASKNMIRSLTFNGII